MKKLYLKILAIIVPAVILLYGYLYINYTPAILMYHSLDGTKTKTYVAVSPQSFYRQMNYLKKNKYKVISLSDYCKILKENKHIDHNLVIITFDDGYKDNLIAAKILKKFDFPATIFLITKSIGQPGFLSREDINYILKNTKVTIGSHTNTHQDLSKMTKTKLDKEIFGSKSILGEMFETKIETMTYPGGAFNEEAMKTAKDSGYLCACTTNRGFSRNIDRFSLRRIKITENDTNFSLWAKLSGFYNIFKKPKKP